MDRCLEKLLFGDNFQLLKPVQSLCKVKVEEKGLFTKKKLIRHIVSAGKRSWVTSVRLEKKLQQEFGYYTSRPCEFFALLIDLYKLQFCDTVFRHDP